MDLSFLPAVNACLNAVAASFLTLGLVRIRQKREREHRRAMLAAFAASSVFLVFYVLHKIWRDWETTPYHGEGVARTFYLVVLATHVVLAMTVPVFAIVLIRLGLRRRIGLHRRLARIAWPIWMYVSATGVLIYLMLYRWNPVPV